MICGWPLLLDYIDASNLKSIRINYLLMFIAQDNN